MYNSYNPYNFSNPYGYTYTPYYNQFTQPQPQPQMQQQNTQQQAQPTTNTNTNKIFVSGIDDVKNKSLPFNSDVIFLDNDKPILYQKTVDSKGQFEVKAFDITPHNNIEDTKETGKVDLSNYVPRSDFEALQGRIKGLEDKLSKLSLQAEVNSLPFSTKNKEKASGGNE